MIGARDTRTGEVAPRRRHVVIAEDEAIIRLDLRELLEEEGYAVVGETGQGDEAVSLVRALEPDVVILDVKMPRLDGLTAARAIAADGRVAVVILTAFSARELIEQARDAGALAYLVKPFDKRDTWSRPSRWPSAGAASWPPWNGRLVTWPAGWKPAGCSTGPRASSCSATT